MNTIHNNVTGMFSITDLDLKIYDYMITFVFTHILPEALLLNSSQVLFLDMRNNLLKFQPTYKHFGKELIIITYIMVIF